MVKNETYEWLMVEGTNGVRRIEKLGWRRLARIYYRAKPGSTVRRAINNECRRSGYTPRIVLGIHA